MTRQLYEQLLETISALRWGYDLGVDCVESELQEHIDALEQWPKTSAGKPKFEKVNS